MTRTTPANWVAAVESPQQKPVYYVDIDGVTDDYATAPVKGATPSKDVRMRLPSGNSVAIDLLQGTRDVQEVEFELLDIGSEITDLIATEASGAPVSTMVNRKVTLYGGYRDLDESDYAVLFVGRLSGVRQNPEMTGWVFRASDNSYLLDGEIMSNATSDEPTTLRGNPFNLYWAILTGTFSTSDPDFPLDFVSAAGPSSSAPTGLGIATSQINETQIKKWRDEWHIDAVANVTWNDPVNARTEIEQEFTRIWQGSVSISGDGLLGLILHRDNMPASAAVEVTQAEHIVRTESYELLYSTHINAFVYREESTKGSGTFDTITYNTVKAEDTADQSSTEETITYTADSRWLDTTYDGDVEAGQLADYLRARYINTPGALQLLVNFQRLTVEVGDSIAVTHNALPDLLDGTRGVTGRLYYVVGIEPDFDLGLIRLTTIDLGFRRSGVISPSGQNDYATSTAQEQNTFVWIGASGTNLVGSSEPGYTVI